MRRIDEPFLKHPFYGSRRMVRRLCRIPRTGFTRICSRAWRSSGPIRSGAARLPVSGGGHGLGEPTCLGLAAVEHPGRGLPCRGAGSPASPFRGECAPGRGRNSRDRAETSKEATRGDRSARRRMYETIRLRLRGHSPLRIPGWNSGVEIAGSLASSSDWQQPTVGWPSRA